VRDEVKRVIETGYDAMAERFAAWQQEIEGSTHIERVEALLALLPEQPAILELGVGAGVQSSRLLAERGRLTGVDISGEQLRRARERIPGANFVHADITELELDPASFDAVVAAYVLNHVPQDELGPLVQRVASWLRPGGHFLATFPTNDNPGWTGEWLGVEMFFAGFPPGENRQLVEAAGLEVLRDEIEVSIEPDDGDSGTAPGASEARFQWLLARKPQ
jgi:SAM-dependent methyltransferase